MNDQRKVIFGQSVWRSWQADDFEILKDMRDQVIDDLVDEFMPPKSYADQWDVEAMQALCRELGLDLADRGMGAKRGVDDEIDPAIEEAADANSWPTKRMQFGDQTDADD
jgi:preprotein translocase subunit SecA